MKEPRFSVAMKLTFILYLIVFSTIFFLSLNFFDWEEKLVYDDCELLDTQWYAIDLDGEKTAVDVPVMMGKERGKTCYFVTTLPDNLEDNKVLCFNSVKQDYFAVFIDKEQVATYYDEDDVGYRVNCGDIYMYVPVNSDDSGKTMEVAMSSRTKYSGNLRETYYGSEIDVFLTIARQTVQADISAIAIMVAAIVAILICLVFRIIFKTKTSFIYLALFVAVVCAWIISESNLRQFIGGKNVLMMDVTYWSLFACPIPLLIYINDTQKYRYNKLFTVAISVSTVVCVAANIACVIFEIDFSDLIRTLWISIGLGGGSILYTTFKDRQRGFLKEYQLVATGFVGIIFTGSLQLISYELNKDSTTTAWLAFGLGFLLVMAGAQALVDFSKNVNEKAILRKSVAEKSVKIEKLSEQALVTLSQTIDAKDKYTNGHSRRVADYSMLIAKKIGLDKDFQSTIYYTALLHDIGKIGIADSILNKEGKLTSEEYDVIKSHTTIGYDILKQMTEISQIEYGARWHHERFDGKGYPEGLVGKQIPLNARIIAVADAYDAMTSKRVYRDSLSKEYVREEFVKQLGGQFDPVIGQAMIDIMDKGILG